METDRAIYGKLRFAHRRLCSLHYHKKNDTRLFYLTNVTKRRCTPLHTFHFCSKMRYHHVLQLVLVIVLGHHVRELSALRCARKCLTGIVPLGTSHPFLEPCTVVDVDPATTECTAAVAIKLTESVVLGYLDIQPRTTSRPSSLEVILDFNMDSTVSMINYTCSMSDNCDQEFVVETVGSPKWAQLNETKTHAEIASLLFEPSFTRRNFTCAHQITCERPYDNCQAHLIQDATAAAVHSTEFDNNYNCTFNHRTEIGVVQYFNRPGFNRSVATHVYCNKNGCNEQSVVERAYEIIHTEFILPFNYSRFVSEN